jgi:omega-amidase
MDSFKIALVQSQIQPDKPANLERAKGFLQKAAEGGAKLAVLPELFDAPYDAPDFVPLADPLPDGETGLMLSQAARQHGIHIAGSSVELGSDGRAYNTGTIWSPEGELIHKQRKVHLYDVDIPGGVTFKESDFFGYGDSFGVVKTELGVLGMVICHDMRFPELFRPQSAAGADIIIVPAAFNLTSGPAHWDILIRTRAMENTVYMAVCGGGANPRVDYPYWGHSTLADPYGDIIARAKGRDEEIVWGEFSRERLNQVRQALPVLEQRKPGVYQSGWMKPWQG